VLDFQLSEMCIDALTEVKVNVKDFSFYFCAFAVSECLGHRFFMLLFDVLNYLAVLSHQETLMRMIF